MSRPIRPSTARREGLSIQDQPASTKRVYTPYSKAELMAFTAQFKHIQPEDR